MSAPLVKTGTPGLYRRGSRYCVVYRDPQGIQRKRAAATLAEARAVQAELRADVARGEYRPLARVTFGEYAQEWIGLYVGRTSRGLNDQTRKEYARALERHAVPFLGQKKLAAIEPRDLKALAAHIQKTGVRTRTVQLALAPVKALLATAVEDGLIRSNPAANLRLVIHTESEREEARVKAMTEDQLRSLLAEIPPEWQLFHEFLAQTGLRIGEAVELRFGDVDLGRQEIRVERNFYKGRVGPPKSSYGRRRVPIAPYLAQALWTLRGERLATDDDLVFVASRLGRVNQGNVWGRILKPAARRAGVPWASFHSFRHTYATLLFRAGWNAVQVQHVLGHHKASFTLDRYVHLLDDDLPRADFLEPICRERGNEVATRVTEIDRDPIRADGMRSA